MASYWQACQEALLCAETMQLGLKHLKPQLQAGDVATLGKIVIGTVEGDPHDIGYEKTVVLNYQAMVGAVTTLPFLFLYPVALGDLINPEVVMNLVILGGVIIIASVLILNQDQKNLDSGAGEMRAETDLKEVDVE